MIDIIQHIVRGEMPVQVTAGKVTSVDENAGTCDVLPLNGPERYDVRLRAVADGRGTGVMIVPKTGSLVLIGIIDNMPEQSFVVAVSEVEKILVRDASYVEINGDTHGGLVISQEVAGQLNEIKNQINQLKQILTSWTPVPSDGGGALKTAVTAWASQSLPPVNAIDLENRKVKHGE